MVQTVNTFEISRKYGVKSVAHLISYPRKFTFGDVYVTDINYVRKQDDPGRTLMIASNFKTFIGYRIFQSDAVSRNLVL